ncbi:MAG: UbiA family prenyltransferase [Dehalococcoidia bacterium]
MLYLFRLLRTKQWIKNGLLFFPLLLNIEEYFSLTRDYHYIKEVGLVCIGFMIFNFASSAAYIVNDLLDIVRDKFHPTKKLRPLARGIVEPIWAVGFAIFLIIGSIISAYLLDEIFALIIGSYFVISCIYSAVAKHVFLLDIVSVASGYVLRLLAGSVIIGFNSGNAILLSIFLIAIYVSLSKRRAEIILLGSRAVAHRPILTRYSIKFIDICMLILVPAIVLTYRSYLFSYQVYNLYAILAFAIFIMGILRYLYLTYNSSLVGSPEDVFIRDKILIGLLVSWLIFSSVNPISNVIVEGT